MKSDYQIRIILKRSDIYLFISTALVIIGLNILYYINTRYFKEGGYIQSLQVLLLIILAITCFRQSFKKKWEKYRILLRLFGLFAIFLFLEEIDYGQQIFQYSSPAFFARYAFQPEFSLHHLLIGAVEIPVHLILGLISVLAILKWLKYESIPILNQLPKFSQATYFLFIAMVLYFIVATFITHVIPFVEMNLTIAELESNMLKFRHYFYQEVIETVEYIIAIIIINTGLE